MFFSLLWIPEMNIKLLTFHIYHLLFNLDSTLHVEGNILWNVILPHRENDKGLVGVKFNWGAPLDSRYSDKQYFGEFIKKNISFHNGV